MNRDVEIPRKRKPFYGWIALAGAALVFFTSAGAVFQCYGVFLLPMSQELDLSRAAMGGALSISVLVSGLPSPLIGASVARFGPRINIIFGNSLVVMGLGAMSLTSEIWHLYLLYGVLVGLGSGFGTFMAVTTVVNNWFIRKQSLGMGLVLGAGALAGIVFPPFATWLIDCIGWQMSWIVIAGVHLVGAVIVGGLVLIRNRPEAFGQTPDGLTIDSIDVQVGKKNGIESEAYPVSVDWPLKRALRTRALWLIMGLAASNVLVLGTIMAHQVAYLGGVGLSPMDAAMVYSLLVGVSLVGRLGFGILAVRINVRYLAVACAVIQVIALVILVTTSSMALIFLYAVLIGISYGALIVALPTIVGIYYGRTDYARILGFILPFVIIVQAVGPIMAGGIFDTAGTYIPAFAVLIASSSVGLVCAALARPPRWTC